MAQPKTVRRLIRELENYFKMYGDAPCYIAMGNTIQPLTDSAVGSVYPEEETRESTSASMTVVFLCDPEAYAEAQRESDETEALTDSTYDE